MTLTGCHPAPRSRPMSLYHTAEQLLHYHLLVFRHILSLVVLFGFVLPALLPCLLWDESFSRAFFVSSVLRLTISMHATWLINSAAHMWGHRPYDRRIEARENLMVSCLAAGEGFHNYHHSFPQDYRASEFGPYFNLGTAFIDVCCFFGLAYDCKTVSKEVISKRKLKKRE